MRPCKLKFNEKQKRLSFLIKFFFNGQNLLLQNWKFSTKMLKTRFPVILVFRLKFVNESL